MRLNADGEADVTRTAAKAQGPITATAPTLPVALLLVDVSRERVNGQNNFFWRLAN
jgi:hypothetical protein